MIARSHSRHGVIGPIAAPSPRAEGGRSVIPAIVLWCGILLAPARLAVGQVDFFDINPDNEAAGFLLCKPADLCTAQRNGGRVNGLAVVPDFPGTYFAASETGGLFKSTDGGASWDHLDGYIPAIPYDVGVEPGGQRVFATSFNEGRLDVQAVLQVSNDGGLTWNPRLPAAPAMCSAARSAQPSAFGIALRPGTSDVFVGTNCGLALSNDAGDHWTRFDPTPNDAPSHIWDIVAMPGGRTYACGDDGLLTSPTGQPSPWINLGMPPLFPGGYCSLAVSPDDPSVVFVAFARATFTGDLLGVGCCNFPPSGGGPEFYEAHVALGGEFPTVDWTQLPYPDDVGGGDAPDTITKKGRVPIVATNKRAQGFDVWLGDGSLWRVPCSAQQTPSCPTDTTQWFGSFTDHLGTVQDAHGDSGDLEFNPGTGCPTLYSSDGGIYANSLQDPSTCHDPVFVGANVGLHAFLLWDMEGVGIPGVDSEDIYFATQDNGLFYTSDGGKSTPSWVHPLGGDVFDVAADDSQVVVAPGDYLQAGDRGYQNVVPVITSVTVTISGATNATPIVITTATPHGYATDDFVQLAGVGGNTAANGNWTITVLTTTTFSLNGSAGNGGYTSGGTATRAALPILAVPDLIARVGAGRFMMVVNFPTSSMGTPIRIGVRDITDIKNAPFGSELGTWASTKRPCHIVVAVGPKGAQPYVLAGQCDWRGSNGNGGAAATTDELWTYREVAPGVTDWTQIALPSGTGFGLIAVDPVNPDRLYASVVGGQAPMMVRSNDGGTTWALDAALSGLMSGGGRFLPYPGVEEDRIYTSLAPLFVAFDPEDPGVLVAGGSYSGVFLSSNGGANWSLLSDPFTPGESGIPHLPRPLFAHFDHDKPDTIRVYLGTGRGVWRVDLAENDISVTKSGSPDPVVTGAEVTYSISVSNNGPSSSGPVILTDELPANVVFQSLTPASGWSCTVPTVGSEGTVTCTRSELPAASVHAFSLVGKVDCPVVDGALITNTAIVASALPDPTLDNNTASATIQASNPPPVIHALSAVPSVLTPPNHKMRPVTLEVDVTDNCGAPICHIVSITSSEPIDGTGDGDTSPDWEITGNVTAKLRAERAGNGPGRIYTLTVECTDSAGNTSSRSTTVTVPHN
jgi:uncharacterized repeat protein (TIGR01451 family)